MMRPSRIGSLFSGIGGLELGLERAGVGRVVWQVESDPYCRDVLAQHWPRVKRYDDVRTVGRKTLSAADVVCGGFPCQDLSSAGKRAGIDGASSGLWFQFDRIVSELRPRYVVVENVASGARAWVDVVVRGLEQHGYACLPIPLAAADVGAPHRRERVFILAAHADAKSQPARAEHAKVARASAATADAGGEQLRQQSRRRGGPGRTRAPVAAVDSWRRAEPGMVRVVHGVSGQLDTRRVRALGNAVVPSCAEVIGIVMRMLMTGDTSI